MLKPNLLKAQEAKRTKRQLMCLKYDTRIFNALLPKQKQIIASANGLGIAIGNPQATNTIIKVCNPYCGPCATAHPIIDELSEANPNIKVQVLFTATNHADDIKAKPVKHLLAIAAQQNQTLTKQALDDWYLAPKKDYEAFAAKYPLTNSNHFSSPLTEDAQKADEAIVLNNQNHKIEAMTNWNNEIKIEFTPTFFINGYQLPDVYTVADLKYLLS